MTYIASKYKISLLAFVACFVIFSEDDIPIIGDASSSAISIASEYNLGRLYMAQLRRSLPEYLDPVSQDYTEHLVYRLSEFSELTDRRLEIAMIDEKSINAFAAPGGIVGVNAGLIFHTDTEGQLASVLSHELAHLSQRHFARRMQRQKDRSLANSLIDLGVDAVICSHTHRVQGAEIYQGKPIIYGLGNWIFPQHKFWNGNLHSGTA